MPESLRGCRHGRIDGTRVRRRHKGEIMKDKNDNKDTDELAVRRAELADKCQANKNVEPSGVTFPFITECGTTERMLELQTMLLVLTHFSKAPAHDVIFRALEQAVFGLSFANVVIGSPQFAELKAKCKEIVHSHYRNVKPGQFLLAISDVMIAQAALADASLRESRKASPDKPVAPPGKTAGSPLEAVASKGKKTGRKSSRR